MVLEEHLARKDSTGRKDRAGSRNRSQGSCTCGWQGLLRNGVPGTTVGWDWGGEMGNTEPRKSMIHVPQDTHSGDEFINNITQYNSVTINTHEYFSANPWVYGRVSQTGTEAAQLRSMRNFMGKALWNSLYVSGQDWHVFRLKHFSVHYLIWTSQVQQKERTGGQFNVMTGVQTKLRSVYADTSGGGKTEENNLSLMREVSVRAL